MRLLVPVLLLSAPAFACSCFTNATPCSGIGPETAVFLGRVLVDSGEGWGTGPARVLIEEKLFSVPDGLEEVEIQTGYGTSCYRRLKAGDRYVIFGWKANGKYSVGGCNPTFLLQGNEHIFDALRNKARGGPPRLVGMVRRRTDRYGDEGGVAGVRVTARSEAAEYTAISDSLGRYELRAMTPGRYRLEVAKPGFVPDGEYNSRWSGRTVLNPATQVHEPDKEDRGSVDVPKGSCEVWDLAMWARGRIGGSVANREGAALVGVTVQAFAFDKKGARESRPLRTGVTDKEGRYRIEPLPPGEYEVGVNAEKYSDADAYPPTVLRGPENKPFRIRLGESESVDAVNLMLPPKRTPATLRVDVVGPNGKPYAGAIVTLENLAGVQRFFSMEETGSDGVKNVPVYVGEHYVVKVFAHEVNVRSLRNFEGSSRVEIRESGATVTVVLAERQLRE